MGLGSGLAGGTLAGMGGTMQSTQRFLAGQTAAQRWFDAYSKKMNLAPPSLAVAGGEPGVQRDRASATVDATTAGRANMYISLSNRGQLQKLKEAQPDIYKMLEDAYKKSRR